MEDFTPTKSQAIRIFLALILFSLAFSINQDIYPTDYTNDTLISGDHVYNGNCEYFDKEFICYTTWRPLDFDTGVTIVIYRPGNALNNVEDKSTDLELIRKIWNKENDFDKLL